MEKMVKMCHIMPMDGSAKRILLQQAKRPMTQRSPDVYFRTVKRSCIDFLRIFSSPILKILFVNCARKMEVCHIMLIDGNATKLLLHQTKRPMAPMEVSAHLMVTLGLRRGHGWSSGAFSAIQ